MVGDAATGFVEVGAAAAHFGCGLVLLQLLMWLIVLASLLGLSEGMLGEDRIGGTRQ